MRDIEEKYPGEFNDFLNVVRFLEKQFPKVSFEIEYDYDLEKFRLEVSDFDVYMSDKYKSWCKILRKKYKKIGWFSCYLKSN